MQNYLELRLVRLKSSETYADPGQGFCFVLVKSGSGQYLPGSGGQNLMNAGDVLVFNSTEGGEVAAANGGLVFWCFTLCLDHLSPLFAHDEISLLQDTTENFKGSKLYPASSLLAAKCHRQAAAAAPQGGIDHRSSLLGIAAGVLMVEFENVRRKRGGFVRIEDHILQVFEELSTNDLLTLSIEDLAHKFGCSRRHLARLFHQYFGSSIAGLRMEMRLLKALSLLRDPDLTA